MVPFVSGILAGVYLSPPSVSPILLSGAAVVFYYLIQKSAVSRTNKFAIHLLNDVFLFLLAIVLVQFSDHRNKPGYFGQGLKSGDEAELIVYPDELPVLRNQWRRCELQVTHIRRGEKLEPAFGKILAYFSSSDTVAPQPGATLLLHCQLSAVSAPLNPGEFNYRAWLENKQIYYTCFLNSSNYKPLNIAPQINTVWKFGLDCRAFLLNALKDSPLDSLSYAICAALLTGQDDYIDRGVMTAFAHSGTLHVLSVSGLHTGLVYLALNFVFGLFAGKQTYKLQRFLFITCGLWLFGLMTGFAAPVLRAVIMFNLMGYGRIYFRNDTRNQLNILFVAAFILLFYNPYYLFEAGFLLSFSALTGLICITPRLQSVFNPVPFMPGWMRQSISASIAATISTLPVTLFFFKQFPIWFFVCNLVVVPASTVLLLLSALMVLKLHFLAPLTTGLVHFMVNFIKWFNTPGTGYVDYLDFDLSDSLMLAAFIITAAFAIHLRSYRLTVAGFCVLIVWQLLSLMSSFNDKQQQLLTVYHVKKAVAYSIKDRRQLSYYLSDSAGFDYHIKPHITSLNYPRIIKQKATLLRNQVSAVLLASDQSVFSAPLPPQIAVVVLSNNTRLPEDVTEQLPALKLIVTDGSNHKQSIAAARVLSRKFGLGFHNTAERGALQLALNETPDR